MSNIKNAKWLKENLNCENLIIVDCRFSLMDKNYGEEGYEKEHIKGAIRIDIEKELSGQVLKHGGRHPLPKIRELQELFESKGIGNDSIVLVYDDGDLTGASRLWWILKYLGHKDVYVLNGGINAFKKIGGETSSEYPVKNRSIFNVNLQETMKIEMEYVRERLYRKNIIIVDCREYGRYTGKYEPVDVKSGHIPNSKSYFWKDILNYNDSTYSIKSKKELELYYRRLKNYEEVIIYCGSGITASVASLALSEIGINHKFYAGSFSDWISYKDNEVCKIEYCVC